MLTWEPNMERELDLTFHKSIPYLLFASDEFREELRTRLIGLYRYCKPVSSDQFDEELKRINEMLKDTNFGENADLHIYNLLTKMQPFDKMFSDLLLEVKNLSLRVKKLEIQGKYPRKSKKVSTNIEPVEIENAIEPKLPLEELIEQIKNPELENAKHSTNNVVSVVDKVPIFADNSKSLSMRIIDYLQRKSPSIISNYEMRDVFNRDAGDINLEIKRMKTTAKYTEQSTHIKEIEENQSRKGKRLIRAYRWVENP